ncbi:galactofuranose ABC transporter, permease protein YjfF [Streptomyces sp. SPB162]|uniref:galactofuranose ABC transporter, permease protein YjfF n=1 Tax=Streptomyces sp. SPB162 TaxID=2940560 RepID=UPI0024054F34|nr:galactofuranose ABC transporter, permease protein YjfF [Streptomyces sp. SPB162]MDF9810983.1 ribose/xylose/arabinose/galactoside ABC-type transport system permease subunit [Streptomyces sp. SPB162]
MSATQPRAAAGRGVRTFLAQHRDYVPVMATAVLFALTLEAGNYRYLDFLAGQTIANLFVDNAFLLVIAVGMTFVILTGGIDLSVGAVAALSTMLCATLVQQHGWPPALVIPVVLAVGALIGGAMGYAIHHFEVQPFIATLAGMFFARGLCYLISTNSIPIDDPVFTTLAQSHVTFPGGVFVSWSVVIALAVVAIAFLTLHYTGFGRAVYAVGGNAQSALLMGVPVGRTVIRAYTVSGLCSALGGVLFTLYTLSGYSLHLVGTELDAIAAVVIGGTILSGGSGYVLGTLLGVLVLGVIKTIITFEGTLSSWWTKIAVGTLLFAFVLLQRLMTSRRRA